MSVQPIIPIWAILVGFILLLAGLGWLEVRRPGRWRNLRLGALALALLAIAGLLLRPARDQIKKEPPILLLTERFDRSIADSILAVHPDWEVYRTRETERYPNSIELEVIEALSRIDHRIAAIAGLGVPAFALEYLEESHYQYFPAGETRGIQRIVQRKYAKGQTNELQGMYRADQDARQLLLQGPAGVVDSIWLREAGLQPFSLSFNPPSSGRWQYRLVEKDTTGRILSDELLPIVVDPQRQLRILILQAFPTFEVRYLKDFLADRGHAVAVRSQLSRSNFRTEFGNLPNRDLSRLNTNLLEDFDLLLVDVAAYNQLSRNELYNLSLAVEQGLGFLGLVNGESAGFRNWLGLSAIRPELDTVRLENGMLLPVYPVRKSPGREWYDILPISGGPSAAAYNYRGKGKVGFQTVQESYAYLLRGDSLGYASVWMPVLEDIRREIYPDYTIEILNDFPRYAGEPLEFRVTANQQLDRVAVDSLPVPMREDPHLQDVWYGRTWPSRTGWHRIAVGEEELDFYAFPEGAWTKLKNVQNRQQTRNAAQTEPSVIADQQLAIAVPISRLWFYLLFLLSAGFLWLAPKL